MRPDESADRLAEFASSMLRAGLTLTRRHGRVGAYRQWVQFHADPPCWHDVATLVPPCRFEQDAGGGIGSAGLTVSESREWLRQQAGTRGFNGLAAFCTLDDSDKELRLLVQVIDSATGDSATVSSPVTIADSDRLSGVESG